jgi:hypothetical protein
VWVVSIAPGVAALIIAGHSWASFGGRIRAGEVSVARAKVKYEDKRAKGKEAATEQKFVDDVLARAGAGKDK